MIPSSLTNLTLRTCWFGGATKRQSNSMRVDSWKLCIKTLLSVRINIPSGCRSPTNFWQAQTTLGSDFTSLEDSHQQIPTLQQIHSLSKTTTKKMTNHRANGIIANSVISLHDQPNTTMPTHNSSHDSDHNFHNSCWNFSHSQRQQVFFRATLTQSIQYYIKRY